MKELLNIGNDYIKRLYVKGVTLLDKHHTYDMLKVDARICKDCSLYENVKNPVIGEGDLNSSLVLVGEAPGQMEDEQGRPFVGSAGKLLNTILTGSGLQREKIFISNIVKCRPPRNRKPTKSEVRACSHHLDQLFEIIKPQVIAPMGNSAIEYIFEKFDLGITIISIAHGKPVKAVASWGTVKIFPLYHPAAVIYNRKLMIELEKDMKKLKSLLEGF